VPVFSLLILSPGFYGFAALVSILAPRRPPKPTGRCCCVASMTESELWIWWARLPTWRTRGVDKIVAHRSVEWRRFAEYPWPRHMAEKIWVDVDEFATAWMIGLFLHRHGAKADIRGIRKSFAALPPSGHRRTHRSPSPKGLTRS
jgi:hypothetical protein